MRDYPQSDHAPDADAKAAPEPRGRAALGLSPKGMFYDWVLAPMKGRGWTIAARAATIALTAFTHVVLAAALYTLLR
ncbi:MAG: hypothetical protein CVT71_03105 [Alphaproteobacteria bacterium HGW-Alphaproteobacteria-10]|nr:MAG: hypothetical protein CVT71_03105 [Alphaproteobacteria bacterium HGW-Alphaproteobacteria-10]